jgi:H+-transporting ATPase
MVTATGAATFFGKTTRLLQEKPPRSHFQKAVIRIGNYLIVLAVSLVSLVLPSRSYGQNPFSKPCSLRSS